ncbi:AraC family transcriptional regulator [Persicobacter psychrovividus]|uniref:Transcriptional regulator n=1 Tax=Persicobacter psychrovividus TaxID=387638 RepID=A0ABN6LC79_9BACT|nr:transcriptional regulator [Persicobacter psychrovividus]
MEDFFKYLLPSADDERLGIFISSVGHGTVAPEMVYPDPQHPLGYYFSWEKGRKLTEYQVLYIARGSGVLEIEDRTINVTEGGVMVIPPNIWHRYRPDKSVGWEEYFVGFSGEFASRFLAHSILEDQFYFNSGTSFTLQHLLDSLMDIAKMESVAFQQIASGLLMQFVGHLIKRERKKTGDFDRTKRIVDQAKIFIQSDQYEEEDLKGFCKERGMSYSFFRKLFKDYTGFSPHQYYLNFKILKAKEMLLSTDYQVKEVAYQLGFSSIYYFSRLFKSKTGVSPKAFKG